MFPVTIPCPRFSGCWGALPRAVGDQLVHPAPGRRRSRASNVSGCIFERLRLRAGTVNGNVPSPHWWGVGRQICAPSGICLDLRALPRAAQVAERAVMPPRPAGAPPKPAPAGLPLHHSNGNLATSSASLLSSLAPEATVRLDDGPGGGAILGISIQHSVALADCAIGQVGHSKGHAPVL